MGWFDTKNKHQQVIVTANAWDMQKIEERNRKRSWFIFLDIIAVICLIIGIGLIYYEKNYITGSIFVLIGLFIFLYFVFKKSFRKTRNFAPQNRNFHRNRHKNFRRHRRRR
jgi:drug/metabolite transporter (DMT)-like permease